MEGKKQNGAKNGKILGQEAAKLPTGSEDCDGCWRRRRSKQIVSRLEAKKPRAYTAGAEPHAQLLYLGRIHGIWADPIPC